MGLATMIERPDKPDPLPQQTDEAPLVVPVPQDDDLGDYLLDEKLADATCEQQVDPPPLPPGEEVADALARTQSAIQNASESNRQISAFAHAVLVLSQIDRRLFPEPVFCETPFERLNAVRHAALLQVSALQTVQRQLSRVCGKNPEMISHGFLQAVLFYLKRHARVVTEGDPPVIEMLVMEPKSALDHGKTPTQVYEDCALAADRLIASAGFSPTLPMMEPPSAWSSTAEPLPLGEFSEGNTFLTERRNRQLYLFKRAADDAPKIELGDLRVGLARERLQTIADRLKEYAISEFAFARKYDTELAFTLARAKSRVESVSQTILPIIDLRESVEQLVENLNDGERWHELDDRSKSAFVRMNNHHISQIPRSISLESIDAARAQRDRSERIRFAAAELMAKNEHPRIKYVEDALLKEAAAFELATKMFDADTLDRRLDDSVRLGFQVETPKFGRIVRPPPENP